VQTMKINPQLQLFLDQCIRDSSYTLLSDGGTLKIGLNPIIKKNAGQLLGGLQLSNQFISEDVTTYLKYTSLVKDYMNGDLYLRVSDNNIELLWYSYFLKEFPEYSAGLLSKGYCSYGLDVNQGTLDGLMKTIKEMIDIFRRITESPNFIKDADEYIENYDRYTDKEAV